MADRDRFLFSDDLGKLLDKFHLFIKQERLRRFTHVRVYKCQTPFLESSYDQCVLLDGFSQVCTGVSVSEKVLYTLVAFYWSKPAV